EINNHTSPSISSSKILLPNSPSHFLPGRKILFRKFFQEEIPGQQSSLRSRERICNRARNSIASSVSLEHFEFGVAREDHHLLSLRLTRLRLPLLLNYSSEKLRDRWQFEKE